MMLWMRPRAKNGSWLYLVGRPAVVLIAVSVAYIQNNIDLGSSRSVHLEIRICQYNILLSCINFLGK